MSNSRASSGSWSAVRLLALIRSRTTTRGIAPDFPIELAVADVERDHARRAPAEEDVGEAAGRGADVERKTAGHVDPEPVERVRELDAAASDIRMIRLDQRQIRVRINRRAGFGHDFAIHADETSEDQRARAFARRHQAPRDQRRIEP